MIISNRIYDEEKLFLEKYFSLIEDILLKRKKYLTFVTVNARINLIYI